ncbi:MAG: malto-oligosyltrehalose trehalohydrolase [Acidimicrobiia bacterium]|nr:malto-oligosyltrehalose trehalohydrolase [Acidimicrobiia bacterium]
MTVFEVWAPGAQRVAVTVDGQTEPMAPQADGWWRATVDGAAAGSRYGYSVDGGPVRPDPRSPSQPDGVDDLSELVDHSAFGWTDNTWRGVPLRGAIIYELHVGTFTPAGTFEAVIERLPHLVALGIDAIELMPVAEFSGDRGWGYDGADLYAPHHAYGGPSGLKRLVDACHGHGLGVILDVVYNHLGPAGNYLAEFAPYFSEQHQTNWGAAINFDGPGSDHVRRFVIDNALMWLRDYHIDGLRLDAVHAIVDESACHLLEQLATETEALAAHVRRPLFLIAESDLNDPRFIRSRDGGGMGIDSAWADEWHHALHSALTGEQSGYYEDFGSLELLAKGLRQAWVYDGTWSPHRRRHHGRPPTGLQGHQFVVCTQNHDQIGNRALGDRSASLMSDGRLRISAALLLTAPFVPMLFQGEEWGASSPFQYFTAHRDPDLGRAVSEGRRREFSHFGWDPNEVPDPQDEETFTRSKLRWDEVDQAPHRELLAWHRELIALRRAIPALSDPRLDRIAVDVNEECRCLTITRGPVRLLVNLGGAPAPFTVSQPVTVLTASHSDVRIDGTAVVVPPDAVAIVEVRSA